MSDGWRLACNKEDRANAEKVRKVMVKLGFPGEAITISDVLRFALKRVGEGK